MGFFCSDTEASVRAFQQARGLAADGQCGEYTWSGLVEASRRLGDRLLLLTAPNLRGDDIAAIQHSLGRLGFDCGKVDGIFGPLTAHALEDFQRNCGLLVDGVCGPVTLQAIERVGRQSGTGPGVPTLRERDRLRSHNTSLRQLRLAVGQFGGLSTLTRVLTRELRTCGALVISVDEPDARIQADAANHFEADVYLGFETTTTGQDRISFYSVPTFESSGGRSLAERVSFGLGNLANFTPAIEGMRLQVLRETKMTAILVSIADVRRTVDLSLEVSLAVRDALEVWTGSPLSG